MESSDFLDQYLRNLPDKGSDVVLPGISGDKLKEIEQLTDWDIANLDCVYVQLKLGAIIKNIRDRKIQALKNSFDDLAYQKELYTKRQQRKAKRDIDTCKVNKTLEV